MVDTKSDRGGKRPRAGRKPLGDKPMDDSERSRLRTVAPGAPTMKAADRELRFQEALRATLPAVKPEAPRWFRGKRPLEITLKRTTHYA